MTKSFYPFLLSLAICFALMITYSATTIKARPNSSIVLVASTPADTLIKSLLGLPAEMAIDFIRWNVVLNESSTNSGSFILNVNYGEAQANTTGFIAGGEKKNISGSYTISKSTEEHLNGNVYRLKPIRGNSISFVKLNDNLFHLLDSANRLLSGNGGWSYTLNRKEPVPASSSLPAITRFSSLPADTSREVIYDGRTPCLELARQYDLQSEDCIKLKWKLIMRRDPAAPLSGTYTINRTQAREAPIEGKWIIKRSENNPDAMICQLDPDKPAQSLSFLMGNENVLFFLNKKNHLFTGNGDFSYTLNRRKR